MTVGISGPIHKWYLTAIDHAQCKPLVPGGDTQCRKPDAELIAPLRVDMTPAAGISRRQDRAILKPTRILLLTHDPQLKNLLETVCMTQGLQMATATLMPEGEGLSPEVEGAAFDLVVVDLAVFGGSEWRQKRLGCGWLRNWTETYPTLPLLFIGTVSQKHAILAIRADTVRFLTRPIHGHELARAIETFD